MAIRSMNQLLQSKDIQEIKENINYRLTRVNQAKSEQFKQFNLNEIEVLREHLVKVLKDGSSDIHP